MDKRRTIIDKKFHLKTTFSILRIITLVFIAFILIIGVFSTNYIFTIKRSSFELKKSIEKEEQTIVSLLNLTQKNPQYKLSPEQFTIITDHSLAMKKIHENTMILEKIISQIKILVLTMIIIGVILAVIFFFYLIRMTHRMSGPIYVLTGYVEDILNGKKPDLREIRKDDEFQDFYKKFVLMLDKFK